VFIEIDGIVSYNRSFTTSGEIEAMHCIDSVQSHSVSVPGFRDYRLLIQDTQQASKP
jgi:hypothetical protein